MEKPSLPQKCGRLWPFSCQWDFRRLWRIASIAGWSLPSLFRMAMWWDKGNDTVANQKGNLLWFLDRISFGFLLVVSELCRFYESWNDYLIFTTGAQWGFLNHGIEFFRIDSCMLWEENGNSFHLHLYVLFTYLVFVYAKYFNLIVCLVTVLFYHVWLPVIYFILFLILYAIHIMCNSHMNSYCILFTY